KPRCTQTGRRRIAPADRRRKIDGALFEQRPASALVPNHAFQVIGCGTTEGQKQARCVERHQADRTEVFEVYFRFGHTGESVPCFEQTELWGSEPNAICLV